MLRWLLVPLIAMLVSTESNAQVNFSSYDLDALGVPKFVNINYIDLSRISQISKFRSGAGHDYHDDMEKCRSMKHYFIRPDASASVFSPVAGTVSRLTDDFIGKQVQIQSDLQPGFVFIIFHVNLATPLVVGQHIAEGQTLGSHISAVTFSDIAVGVNTPTGYRLVSYFDTLTDAAFAAFQARGIASRSQFITTKAERDAAPYTCSNEAFTNLKTPPEEEYVDLSGAQRLNITNPPEVLSLGDSPYTLVASSTSGLPLAITASGPCTASGLQLTLTGVGTCHVLFDQPGNAQYFPAQQFHYVITLLAAPQGPRLGSVYSSAQSIAQSFLRVANTGMTAESVNVQMMVAATGDVLGEWNSPLIAPGAAAQYPISMIENGTGANFIKPPLYTLAVQTKMSGSVQHVVWTPGAGTLANLSTCDTGVTADRSQLTDVHSSLLQASYPSSIIVTNIADTAVPVQLGLFDSASGIRLGTYTTPSVPGGGQLSVAVPTIEAGARFTPTPANYHYIVKAEGNFGGYLQHLVTNAQTGMITDMTTACPMRLGSAAALATRVGSVFSTAQTDQQSYIRLYNNGTKSGTVKLTLIDSATGLERGQWTSPTIAPEMSPQYSMATIEAGAGITGPKPATYVLTIQSGLSSGYLQHVVWRPAGGTMTDLSTCDGGVSAITSRLNNLHSKLLAAAYPSTIAATNTDTGTYGIGMTTYNAANGIGLAGYVYQAIPRMATIHIPVSTIEALPYFSTTPNISHYTLKSDFVFRGFFQHLVNNIRAGIMTDMTPLCRIS